MAQKNNNHLIYLKSSELGNVTQMELLDWEVTISKIVDMILKEQTPNNLLAIRPLLYELITKYIEPSVILQKLAFGLIQKVNNLLKTKIIEQAAHHVS